jgi:hypothetical protein
MRTTAGVLAVVAALSGSASARDLQTPPPPGGQPAPTPALRGPSGDDDLALSPEIVAKLSAAEIAALLRERERGLRPGGGILVPMAFFGTLAGIVLLSQLFATRRERLRQETLQAMVEKGSAVPEALLPGRSQPSSDLRRGLVLVGAGLGLSLMFSVVRVGGQLASGLWGIGLVPLLMGVGYLATWRIAGPGSGSDR